MSEETVTEEATTEEQPQQEAPAQEPDWKAEARKWEKRAKENVEAAQRLAEIEESKKTEQDKLNERLASLESDHKQSSLEAARLRVALRKGLTETQAKRLVGDTVEDLEADADDLLASFKPADDPSGRPKERLKPGASTPSDPPVDHDKLADSILNRPY